MFRFALMTLVVGFGISSQVRAADDVEKERSAMSGTWKIVSFEIDGKQPGTEEELSQVSVLIDGEGKMSVQINGRTVTESANKIDPAQSPKTLDQTFTQGGGGKGQTALAIYELKDDTLKICYAAPGNPRPTKFTSKGNTMVVYKRRKTE